MTLHKIKIAAAAMVIALTTAGAWGESQEPSLEPMPEYYTVKKGETLYGLSKRFGVSIDRIVELNPTVNDGLRAGERIYLGGEGGGRFENVENDEEIEYILVEESPESSEESELSEDSEGPESLEGPEVTEEAYNVAVMLPLMLGDEKPSKSAEMFTDFYRGFLLAADTLSHSGARINIYAYDTAGSPDTIRAIVSRPEMASMDIIVGPDKDDHFNLIVESIDSDKAFIVNTFAVRNDSYRTNSNVIQTNIPHDMMTIRAIDTFMEERGDRVPVFISRISGQADKEAFTSQLKQRLTDEGVDYVEITYKNVLSESDLEGLESENDYIVVPASGSRTEFIKMVPALKGLKERLDSARGLAMFGYPEWLTFRGDMLDNLSALNAMLYSRFYYDTSSYPSMRVAEKFREVYGAPMIDGVPSQGMLGYDTASFIINGLRRNHGDFHGVGADYDGYQTDYLLDDDEIDGLVNTSMVLVKFNDGGLTESRKI